MATEIERVFLLSGMPPRMPAGELWRIEQGYMAPDATQPISEGRLRRTTLPDGTVTHVHTVKHGVGRVRAEVEKSVSADDFARAWPRTEGRRIRKERTRVSDAGFIWEIDRFLDLPLVLAECELDYPDQRLEIPAWLQGSVVREVTEEPEYRNYHLAVRAGQAKA